jgi:cytidylate kinase
MTALEKEGKQPKTIAIDGPGASGKTTVGVHLAEYLNYCFLDTGVMYRTVTALALRQRIGGDDEAALTQLAKSAAMEIAPLPGPNGVTRVTANGRDVTGEIYTPEVDRAVSAVSMVGEVRDALVLRQRELAGTGGIVMVGRDIGTKVLPKADLKVFLLASAEERARRRYEQNVARGEDLAYEKVLEDLKHRDKLDSERKLSPLVAASDARHVDTDERTAEQVTEAICALFENS